MRCCRMQCMLNLVGGCRYLHRLIWTPHRRCALQVADIKRANCLDSDTTMYGRGTLLVPTRPMPLNAELAAWVSLTEAQMNSKGIAHRPVRYLRPGVIGALTELRGYYSTGPSLSPSPLYSDGEDEDQGDAEESLIDFEALRQGLPGRRARSPREVELMTRNGSQGASSSYIEERLRRRKGPGEDDDGCMSVEPTGRIAGNPGCINDSTAPLPQSSKQKHLFESSLEGRRARSGNSMGGLQDINFQEWKRRGQQWRDQVLNRLKRAASQPALLQTAASLVSRASGPSFGGPDLGNRMSQPGSVVQPGSAGASSSGTLAGIGLRPSKESSKAD